MRGRDCWWTSKRSFSVNHRSARVLIKAVSEAIKDFAKVAKSFCSWAEGDAHSVAAARSLILQLVLQVTLIDRADSANASSDADDDSEEREYAWRGIDRWKVDFERFSD